MMHTIWRFDVGLFGATVEIPAGATIVHVGIVREAIHIWARVNPEAATIERRFQVLPTGAPFDPADGQYVGTVIDEPLVWHVFEVSP
jgi:hypothetical protein